MTALELAINIIANIKKCARDISAVVRLCKTSELSWLKRWYITVITKNNTTIFLQFSTKFQSTPFKIGDRTQMAARDQNVIVEEQIQNMEMQSQMFNTHHGLNESRGLLLATSLNHTTSYQPNSIPQVGIPHIAGSHKHCKINQS